MQTDFVEYLMMLFVSGDKPMAAKPETLTIGKCHIAVSNLDKLFYPGGKFTKARVIDYYIRIAPYLLPHLKSSGNTETFSRRGVWPVLL